jgi:hypothetical protein
MPLALCLALMPSRSVSLSKMPIMGKPGRVGPSANSPST